MEKTIWMGVIFDKNDPLLKRLIEGNDSSAIDEWSKRLKSQVKNSIKDTVV